MWRPLGPPSAASRWGAACCWAPAALPLLASVVAPRRHPPHALPARRSCHCSAAPARLRRGPSSSAWMPPPRLQPRPGGGGVGAGPGCAQNDLPRTLEPPLARSGCLLFDPLSTPTRSIAATLATFGVFTTGLVRRRPRAMRLCAAVGGSCSGRSSTPAGPAMPRAHPRPRPRMPLAADLVHAAVRAAPAVRARHRHGGGHDPHAAGAAADRPVPPQRGKRGGRHGMGADGLHHLCCEGWHHLC